MIGQSWEETSKQRAGVSELLSRLVSVSMTCMGRHFRAVADTAAANKRALVSRCYWTYQQLSPSRPSRKLPPIPIQEWRDRPLLIPGVGLPPTPPLSFSPTTTSTSTTSTSTPIIQLTYNTPLPPQPRPNQPVSSSDLPLAV